jgi:hypothetical protein
MLELRRTTRMDYEKNSEGKNFLIAMAVIMGFAAAVTLGAQRIAVERECSDLVAPGLHRLCVVMRAWI